VLNSKGPPGLDCKEASSLIDGRLHIFIHHQRIVDFLLPSSISYKTTRPPTLFWLLPSYLSNCNHGTINHRSAELPPPHARVRQHRTIRDRAKPRRPNRTTATPLPRPTTPFSRSPRRNRYRCPRQCGGARAVRRQHHHRYPATELRRPDRYWQF
jgi:hypothetical protein